MAVDKEFIEDDDFEFDTEDQEVETGKKATAGAKKKPADDDDLDIEIEDDTPEQDRGRAPMPKEIVEELESDDLEEYSDKVKTKLKQLKKVWHDERRAKEAALRENQQSLAITRQIMEENKRLKNNLHYGESTLVETYKSRAELQLADAKRDYKDAYDSGDTDKLLDAQERMNQAQYTLQQVKNYKPTPLQEERNEVQSEQRIQIPKPDQKTLSWQERNTWYGTDREMTAAAMGLHQKLEEQNGQAFVGTDEYWTAIDNTMRRRFPEYFDSDGDEESSELKPATRKRPNTVVAPASRSTGSKKVRLTTSEINLARKLGITPEQYAKEKVKLGDNR